MDTTCLRHTQLPHTSRLFQDILYHFDSVKQWYAYPPGRIESYEAAARDVQLAPEKRTALVAALRGQNGDSPNLDLLAQPKTVAIVTGQQVGLFGGPAYSVYKALTAVRIARELTARGTPAVPVFWLATEDHDFAEVDHLWSYNGSHRPVKLTVERADEGQQPVGQVPLQSYPLEELDREFTDLPFAEEALEMVSRAYQPGVKLGDAFRSLFQQLLKQYDLLYLDPLDPAIRQLAAPLLRQAVEQAPALQAKLLARNKELTDHGYHAQVHLEPETSLVFLLEQDRRTPLKWKNGQYVAGRDRSYSPQELMDRASELSPNAILRPVVQDSMLPTEAYVGGPAELAYMAQSEVLYQTLLGRMPVMTSRSGFTLISPRAEKLLARYRLTLPDFFPGEAALRDRMAVTLTPESLQSQFQHTRTTVNDSLSQLRAELLRFDPTLAAALDRSTAKVQYQLQKAEHKIARETMRRTDRAAADAQYLADVLYPHKTLQERLYGLLPFLAEFGVGIVEEIYANVHLDCPDHILLPVH